MALDMLDTSPLLRPEPLERAQSELAVLEKKLHHPQIQEKGDVHRQLMALDKRLNSQTPKKFVGAEKDAAVRMEKELRDKWTDGMLSQEEMRTNPPGAPERNSAWEKRNTEAILQWKNIVLRLHASDGDYSDSSVANIERYRPRMNTMNMDGAQIARTQFFLPPDGARPGVTFSPEQLALLGEIAPDLAARIALLNNTQRGEVKDVLTKQTLHLPKGGKAAKVDDEPL